MTNADTTIRVTDAQADQLHDLKQHRSEPYHQVIARLLDAHAEADTESEEDGEQ